MNGRVIILTLGVTTLANAQSGEPPDTLKPAYEIPQIDVIGRTPELLDRVPGSASIVTTSSLQQLAQSPVTRFSAR